MRFIIPCDTKNVIVEKKRVHWDKDKHYQLGWRFGWFLYNYVTAAFVTGLRDFMAAPLEVQNKQPKETPKRGEEVDYP